ncbi:flagellar basal body-associated FliL family protein [Fuchsiella alkaliacetigena]|uniref:flagellar basal body-associated FliL family protein n=1 Tax=Fuchsiella alkaliacetigena TaxID=957042 RepID=UPI00200B64FE|nr:flagellar basal body-associated FliL family protein [Fuchsiella alkaliacetigena]MCK8823542.1 flagellar basal body-associated FliL family protein [Fuchsiella alkaliacetigena]
MSEETGNFKLMLVIMVILSLLIAAGTSYFMLRQVGGMLSNGEPQTRSVTELGPTYEVGDFIVNLADNRQFVRLILAVEVNDEAVIEELEKRNPQVRDKVISILRDKSKSDINTSAGARDLREEIKEELNQYIPEGEISRVFFTEFVIQG